MSGTEWILNEPLQTVLLRMIILHRYQPDSIDGSLLALFAKRLIQSELAVGGPYTDGNAANTLVINTLVQELFTAFKAPLPNVKAYVDTALQTNPRMRINAAPLISIMAKDMGVIVSPLQSIKSKNTKLSHIAQQVKLELNEFSIALRPIAVKMWQAVNKADHKHEISLLSDKFAQSLHTPINHNENLLETLGKANYYTWMAYTIYDDFIDEEGDAQKLPIANMTHRRALNLYAKANTPTSAATISGAFDSMDYANEWELLHARFKVSKNVIMIGEVPSYKNGDILADRAFGHILGPILLSNIFDQQQKQRIENGLRHYLIARQLNDDLHDWVQDIERGHINFVVAHLLKSSAITSGPCAVPVLTEKLQRIFWETELVSLSRLISCHIEASYRAFADTSLFNTEGPFFTDILAPIKDSVDRSILIHLDQKNFLETYRK